MIKLDFQYVVDVRGRRRAVQLSVREFQRLVDLLEERDDVAYVKAHRHDRLVPMAAVHSRSKRIVSL